MIEAEKLYEAAKISVQEYTEGMYVQTLQTTGGQRHGGQGEPGKRPQLAAVTDPDAP